MAALEVHRDGMSSQAVSSQQVPPRRLYRFHSILRGARYAEGIERQAEAAALVDVSKSKYWEWETGRVRPSGAELAKLRAALPMLDCLLRLAQPRPTDVEVAGRL
jgi:transcriptional regulator with XRE-family HTH domain